MRGEVTAVVSVLSFGLSYIYVNRAQIKGETSDNGLLPMLVISTIILISACLVRLLSAPAEFHIGPAWRMPLLYCLLAGLSWNFLSRMTLLASISRLGATRGIVIKSVAPMMTVAIAVIFLREPLGLGDKLGFIFMLASIALLIVERTKTGERGWMTPVEEGILFGLVSALFQSIGHLLRKMGADQVPVLLGAAVDLTVATLAYALYLIWTGRLVDHTKFYVHHRSLDIFAASVLSALGVLTSFISIAAASVSTVAVILGMQPIIVSILSSLFFRGLEKFTWVSYVATALVVCGVLSILMYGSSSFI
ncbi:MAG: DMT family transporter [Alicyclobacillus herbarius]|uniref:DMT family transporter n=1 Tax=Alicyclobacillus herbarius TaxID=122960 RepID=UPI002352D07D|nr:DMT family transporter [Alicyclobacillus herbarius]MCL6631552.1 DMT family transporter [Alicyclobacillus herbarius]